MSQATTLMKVCLHFKQAEADVASFLGNYSHNIYRTLLKKIKLALSIIRQRFPKLGSMEEFQGENLIWNRRQRPVSHFSKEDCSFDAWSGQLVVTAKERLGWIIYFSKCHLLWFPLCDISSWYETSKFCFFNEKTFFITWYLLCNFSSVSIT